MTINSYLTQIATHAILREDEKAGIQRSLTTLQSRLVDYFGAQLGKHFVFGSYSRGTALPRSMDSHSDVDYMVEFSDSSLQPQSYLDRLRRFAEVRYSRSEVSQSHPTVALELNHIRFELVPALDSWWSGIQIPQRSANYQSWQDTDPRGFNEKLTSANQSNGNLIKPLVRVMKYWNAAAGHPFESFELEKTVAEYSYSQWGLGSSRRLAEYFFQIVEATGPGFFASQWKRAATDRLESLVTKARNFERSGDTVRAEGVMAQLLPPVGSLLGR